MTATYKREEDGVVIVDHVEEPETLMIPDKKGNKHQEVHAPKIPHLRFDERERFPHSHKSGIYPEMMNRLVKGEGPYLPKMAMVVFQNLLMEVVGDLYRGRGPEESCPVSRRNTNSSANWDVVWGSWGLGRRARSPLTPYHGPWCILSLGTRECEVPFGMMRRWI